MALRCEIKKLIGSIYYFMDNFIGAVKHYGVKEGISLYFKLKDFQIDSILTSKLTHEVHLRPGSTDICVFKQIFLKQDFNIPALKKFSPATILDLGANIGMSSLYFANRFPEATIIGVEPDRSNAKMFKRNLKWYPNVKLEMAAVRGDNKKVILEDPGKGASGYVTKKSVNGMRPLTIEDIMLKHNLSHIDLLKIDIEGSEKSVFSKRFSRWLPKVKMIFVELHEHKNPGCTEKVMSAVSRYNFLKQKSGEYYVFVNNDLVDAA